ncbi:LrgB family protein [Chelatococcus reniformis]|uniref:Murein hydrolase effector protein LrgB n=1 Tax=Chelatococcus reniformis TaxID=1494448 RepID=A0A916XNW0_9HYPH|nr:LrgB family protein [Chelatococcus reniformis]GGC87726.1 murein hydrolase effector protein LrgB [Chelatococcus reniformis]
MPLPSHADPLAPALFWSALTIGFYLASKRLYRRWPRWWLMPLAVTPALLIVVVLTCHVSYGDYIGGTGWLVALLGPATVAFAVPIYEQRTLICRHWPVLGIGMLTGCATAVLTGWGLATLLGLDGALRLSLLPRSISTPFAMEVSRDIGGIPDLTAVFVVLTGVLGAVLGEAMLTWLPIRSALARGALLGVGAHGAGTAKAHEIGREEGSIAGLVMVLVGLSNVLLAPALAWWLR